MTGWWSDGFKMQHSITPTLHFVRASHLHYEKVASFSFLFPSAIKAKAIAEARVYNADSGLSAIVSYRNPKFVSPP